MKRATKKSIDPFPERISPQLATLVSAPPTRGAWTYEIKLDGYRILSRCGGGVVRLFTRNENDWTSKMVSLAQALAALPAETAWFDGEVVVLGENGIPNFNALQNAFDTRGTERLTYFVFDLLYLNGKDLRGLEFRQRRELLAALFAENDSERVRLSQTFDADGQSVLQSACKMGLEGVIAKRLDAPYKSTRTDAWLKVKCQLRQEFVVGGFVTRTGSTPARSEACCSACTTTTAACARSAAWERDGTRRPPRRCYARSSRSRSTSPPSIQSSHRRRIGGVGDLPAASDGYGRSLWSR